MNRHFNFVYVMMKGINIQFESPVSSFSSWVHLPFCPTNEKDIKEVQATKKEAGNGTGHSWECEQEGSLQLLKSSLFQYKFLIVGSVFLCTGQNWVAQSLINTKRIYISMCGPFLGLKFRPVPCLLENHFFFLFPRASERRVLPIVGVCKTSSHLHIFSSSHLLIFTSSYPHIFSSSLIFSSSHLLIFTSSHLHTFSSSHLLIFTSSHLHIFSSSHLLLIFSSSHLLISSSSHLHIFSSSHLLIFTSSHIFSHLLTSSHIFSHLLTSSHIFSHLLTSSHIFSHLLIFTSSHLHIFSSCPLALLLSPSFLFLFWRRGQGQRKRDGTKRHPFARNEGRSAKTEVKLRFDLSWSNPFARNEGRSAKTEVKLRFFVCWSNPFARNEGRSSKTEEKLRFYLPRSNPFARNEGRSAKTEVKLRFYLCRNFSHEMSVDRVKSVCGKSEMRVSCKSVCV